MEQIPSWPCYPWVLFSQRERQLILCVLLFDHKVLPDLCRDDPVVHVKDRDYFPGWRNRVWSGSIKREKKNILWYPPSPTVVFDYPIDCKSHVWVAFLICEFCQHSLNCYDEQYQIAQGLSRMCTRKITNALVQRGGNIRCLLAPFHFKWLSSFLYVQWQEFWSFTLRSKGEPINVSPSFKV